MMKLFFRKLSCFQNFHKLIAFNFIDFDILGIYEAFLNYGKILSSSDCCFSMSENRP